MKLCRYAKLRNKRALKSLVNPLFRATHLKVGRKRVGGGDKGRLELKQNHFGGKSFYR